MNDSKSDDSNSRSKYSFWLGAAIGIWIFNFLVLFGILYFIVGILKLPPRDDLVEGEQTNYAATDRPSQSKTNVVSGEPNEQTNTIESDNDKKQSAFDKLVDIRDLKAQEAMWAAAFLLVGIALFQFIASVVALVYIAKTFSATKDTALSLIHI